MDIVFENNKVRKQCLRSSGKLKRRLDDIVAARNMAELKLLPGRMHALKANRTGQWALDLEHPKRLIFEPLADPMPMKNGWLDLEAVFAIRVLEVEDYHGK